MMKKTLEEYSKDLKSKQNNLKMQKQAQQLVKYNIHDMLKEYIKNHGYFEYEEQMELTLFRDDNDNLYYGVTYAQKGQNNEHLYVVDSSGKEHIDMTTLYGCGDNALVYHIAEGEKCLIMQKKIIIGIFGI